MFSGRGTTFADSQTKQIKMKEIDGDHLITGRSQSGVVVNIYLQQIFIKNF